MPEVFLSFYGVNLHISAPLKLIQWIKHDFSYFLSDSLDSCSLEFKLFKKVPPYNIMSGARAIIYRDDYIAYEKEGKCFMDFFGKALSIQSSDKSRVDIFSLDEDFLYERFYLALIVLVGERLERRGLHRIHALAVSKNQKAMLLMLPSGGGKTTLMLELLNQDPGVKILSEDMPLLSVNGTVHSFPLRIGVRASAYSLKLRGRFLRRFKRSNEEDKMLIDVSAFRKRISSPVPSGSIVLGERVFSTQSSIAPVSRLRVFWSLFKNIVFGFETPMIIAYFMEGNARDFMRKLAMFFSRLAVFLALLASSKCFVFRMGRNQKKNSKTLARFLDKVP